MPVLEMAECAAPVTSWSPTVADRAPRGSRGEERATVSTRMDSSDRL
jgi:hypothetical protein